MDSKNNQGKTMPVKEIKMVPARFTLPEKHAKQVEKLVTTGEFSAEADVYRAAVREYFEHHPVSAVQSCPDKEVPACS
jgi:hypothetical protein